MREWIGPCILAALGGTLPTLSRLAATYVSVPSTPLPEIGLVFGLALFAMIGAILCRGLEQRELRQALIVGIAAPGVITNIIAGVSAADSRQANMFFSRALAQSSEFVTKGEEMRDSYISPPVSDVTEKRLTFRVDTKQFEYFQSRVPPIEAYGVSSGEEFRLGYLPREGALEIVVPRETTTIILRAGDKERSFDINANSAEISVELYPIRSSRNDFLWSLGANRRPGGFELRAACQGC